MRPESTASRLLAEARDRAEREAAKDPERYVATPVRPHDLETPEEREIRELKEQVEALSIDNERLVSQVDSLNEQLSMCDDEINELTVELAEAKKKSLTSRHSGGGPIFIDKDADVKISNARIISTSSIPPSMRGGSVSHAWIDEILKTENTTRSTNGNTFLRN